ncbi:MAG: phosphonate metabolism protein/1,5-bisphosphokinase (PRPP-forming) PhnN [Hyphomicrobiales bacterium]
MNGTLVLIAGPSGAGKDTLIRLAQQRLRDDPRFVFVRRVITRPGDAGAEEHWASSDEEFAREAASGAFALHWEAHGLRYGVPREIDADLAAGRVVVVNVSRGVIPEARRRYLNSLAIIVTAPIEMLAARLAARGREPASEHPGRLARPDLAACAEMGLLHVSNDRTPEDGAEALLAILRRCMPVTRQPLPMILACSSDPSSTIGKSE